MNNHAQNEKGIQNGAIMMNLIKVIKPTSVTCIGRTGVRNYAGCDISKYILQMKTLALGDLHGRKT